MSDGEIVAIPPAKIKEGGRRRTMQKVATILYYPTLGLFKRILDSHACLLPIWPGFSASTKNKLQNITDLFKNLQEFRRNSKMT